MRQSASLLSALVPLGVLALGGCVPAGAGGAGGGNGGNAVPVQIGLDGSVADFEVAAGEPTEKIILINLPELNFDIAGGAFLFEPDAFTFVPAAGAGKIRVAAQAAPFDFEVTGFAFSRDPLGTCGTGDTYGPYTVSVDAEGQAFAVDPTELELQPDTVALIEASNIAVCLRVVSPVSGVIHIATMTFELTRGTSDVTP